jgi:hypothetical protein
MFTHTHTLLCIHTMFEHYITVAMLRQSLGVLSVACQITLHDTAAAATSYFYEKYMTTAHAVQFALATFCKVVSSADLNTRFFLRVKSSMSTIDLRE